MWDESSASEQEEYSTTSSFASLVIGFPNDSEGMNQLVDIFNPVLEKKRSFILVKHDPKKAPHLPCEYPEVHLHGITNQKGVDIRNERCWQRVKENIRVFDGWFKSQRVWSLPALCAYLQMPGKEVLINKLSGHMQDTWKNVSAEDIEKQVVKKTQTAMAKKEKSCDINTLRQFMLEAGCFTETELLHKFMANETYITIYKKKNFGHNLEKAKQLASQQIIEMSVEELFDLARKRIYDSAKYLSVEQSVDVVKQWCKMQDIPFRKLVEDLIEFMERKRKKVNTFWMHGTSNAGKSYIARSLQQLAVLYHSVPPGSNRFMWQDCINKRLIVVNEPHLDEAAVEACKEIMEGNGSYVPVKNRPDQYLRPTPVMITSNTYLWSMNQQARGALLCRIYPGYKDLRAADFLQHVKELHPLWLEAGQTECIAEDHGKTVIEEPPSEQDEADNVAKKVKLN